MKNNEETHEETHQRMQTILGESSKESFRALSQVRENALEKKHEEAKATVRKTMEDVN